MPYDAIDLIKKEQSVYGSLRAALFDGLVYLFKHHHWKKKATLENKPSKQHQIFIGSEFFRRPILLVGEIIFYLHSDPFKYIHWLCLDVNTIQNFVIEIL